MVNKIFRVVLGIIVACGVLFGIYYVLPGQYKHPITQGIQQTFQSDVAMLANTYKFMKVPENDMTFEQMMKGATSGSCWVVTTVEADRSSGVGTYEVHAYGFKTTISMPKENGDEKMKTYTERPLEIVFFTTKGADGKVTNSGYKVIIDNEEQNEYYRQAALNWLCGIAAGQQ